jgi:hypothetical protein
MIRTTDAWNAFWALTFLGGIVWYVLTGLFPENSDELADRVARLYGTIARIEHTEPRDAKHLAKLERELADTKAKLERAQEDLVDARAKKAGRRSLHRVFTVAIAALVIVGATIAGVDSARQERRRRAFEADIAAGKQARKDPRELATAVTPGADRAPAPRAQPPPIRLFPAAPAATTEPDAASRAAAADAPKPRPAEGGCIRIVDFDEDDWAEDQSLPAASAAGTDPIPSAETPAPPPGVELLVPGKAWQPSHWAGDTPVPESAMSGAELERWWRSIVAIYRRVEKLRDQPCEHQNCSGCHKRRYGFKVEMKNAEYVLALVHGTIAPAVSYLCAADCVHVHDGMSAVDVKRVLDTLQHRIDESSEYVGRHPDADWAAEEEESTREARDGILHLLDSPVLNEHFRTKIYFPRAKGQAATAAGAGTGGAAAAVAGTEVRTGVAAGAEAEAGARPLFALTPDVVPSAERHEVIDALWRELEEAIGASRDDKLRSLLVLRERGVFPFEKRAELQEQLASRRNPRLPTPQFLETQLKAVRRPDFPTIVELYAGACTVWDTWGLRPGSGGVIIEGLIAAENRAWKSSCWVGSSMTVLSVQLPIEPTPRLPYAELYQRFDALGRSHGFSTGGGRLYWKAEKAPVPREQFAHALHELPRLAARLVDAVVRAYAHPTPESPQLAFRFLEEGVREELFH